MSFWRVFNKSFALFNTERVRRACGVGLSLWRHCRSDYGWVCRKLGEVCDRVRPSSARIIVEDVNVWDARSVSLLLVELGEQRRAPRL
ncbi:unnamed protein product [Pieris brassicae]|uniref:Uncharacterized protein n=1 Tax=Pieris brassicae TaxID=7116 RepID=A0A9P0XJY1_PIEBR|nr:unnamed protein product [Pieris brassicae]